MYVGAATALSLVSATAIGAASFERRAAATPLYSAFSVVAQRRPAIVRCGGYRITRATYTGRATSPDPRLAGRVTLRAQLITNPATGDGVARGVLTIRNPRRRLRARANLAGVIVRHVNVNGILSGRLVRPNALLLANVTLFFDPRLRFAGVRVGLNTGENSAVAYRRLRSC